MPEGIGDSRPPRPGHNKTFSSLSQFVSYKRRHYRDTGAENLEMIAVAERFAVEIVFWEESSDGFNIKMCPGGYKPSNAKGTVNILVSIVQQQQKEGNNGDAAAGQEQTASYHFNSLVRAEDLHVAALLGPEDPTDTCADLVLVVFQRLFIVFPCLCCLVMSCLVSRRQGGYEIGGGDRRQAAALARNQQQRSVSLSPSPSGDDFQILLDPSGNSLGTTSPAPGGGREVGAPPPPTPPPPTPTPSTPSSVDTMSRVGSSDKQWHLLASDVVGNNTPELDTREFVKQRQKPNVLPWVVCFLFASTLFVMPSLLRVKCSTHHSLVKECPCSGKPSRLGGACRRG